jgi:hypothetical protein
MTLLEKFMSNTLKLDEITVSSVSEMSFMMNYVYCFDKVYLINDGHIDTSVVLRHFHIMHKIFIGELATILKCDYIDLIDTLLENGVERISFETYCKIKEELKK